MSTEPIANRCPKCQAPLPVDAPQGLCPKCLLAAASTPTEAGQAARQSPPPPIEEVAAAFPQLQILELIGQGGMGVVYKARQLRLDRLVALKLLPQSLAADVAFAERFNREARVLARLSHANIVTVHDFGQSGGFFFLLMEFVDGVNLRQAMQAGRFTPQQAMMLVPKICEALQFAHDEGILHRDIKPENILLDTRGRVKIADFGIAKLLGEAREKLTLTASGHAIGTPHYMAPEQLEHPQDVDQRADIYSLGVVFYEMLTGELPIGRFAPPSTKSTVDPRVDEVVFHALEKEREKRFRSATEVKTSVEAITGHQPTAAPPPASQAPPLRATCYFNTPARMRDCFPSGTARVFTCRGELALGPETLTFTTTWRSTISIPLKDIEDVSVGQFQMWTTPWVTKYARFNFLSVTFRGDEESQTVHLTPVELGAMTAGLINDCVGRWFERVRQAAQQCTGTAPHASDTALMTVSAEPAWNRKCLPLIIGCLLIGGLTLVLEQFGFSRPPWLPALSAGALLLLGLSAVTFLRANHNVWHGQLDAVTSDDPPSPEPAQAPPKAGEAHRQAARWARTSLATTSMAMLAIILLLSSLSHRSSRKPPSRSGTERQPATATVAATPESKARFVLCSMPVPTNNDPSRVDCHFKCLIPANHLARVLFIRWTNGVPTINDGFSGYFKVGKSPSVQDFSISSFAFAFEDSASMPPPIIGPDGIPVPPPPPALADTTVKGVSWAVNLFGRAPKFEYLSGEAPYRRLPIPSRMTVRPGHQGTVPLADQVDSDGQSTHSRSGIELRIFMEPINYTPVRIDPFEIEGTNYVAGRGPGWTEDEALKAIKEWPIDQ